MFKSPLYYISFLIFFSCSIMGQNLNETRQWRFGFNAGLDFNTSPPTIVTTSTMSVPEGCASIADASGNLLFYTDGLSIYNQANTVMANGSGLNGGSSTTQGAIIVKKPGTSSLYYVFTLGDGGTGSLSYSIVDMSLAAGMGSVTSSNNLMYSPSAEKLIAVRHCNKTDYWIISHETNSNTFRSYLLSASGVSSGYVSSSAGSTYTGVASYNGYLKSSPSCRQLACIGVFAPLELFDFDPATGLVSNPLTMATFSSNYTQYGIEFSPDGSKLYACSMAISGPVNAPMYQWDLASGSPSAVVASSIMVDPGNTPTAGSMKKYALQLAPDGKIYCARMSSTLSVINNPNASGTACNFVEVGLSAGTSTSFAYLGLPNFSSHYFYVPPPPCPPDVNDSAGCLEASFNAQSALCSAAGSTLINAAWDFGDPSSGANNFSNLFNPSHTYPSSGTYTAQLIRYYSPCNNSDTVRVPVSIAPCFIVTPKNITCASLGSASVSASGTWTPFSYTWMPTAQTGTLASNLIPGTYTLFARDTVANKIYTVTTALPPLVPLTGYIINSDSVHCYGAATGTAGVTQLAGGSGSELYAWTKGSVTYTVPNPTNLTAGAWSALITDALTSCTIQGGFFILQPPALNLLLAASSPSACIGNSVVLSGTLSGGTQPVQSYSWSQGPATGSYTTSIPITGSNSYSLTAVDAYTCPITKTISVLGVANPSIVISSVSICPLESGTLNAAGATSYSWNGVPGANQFMDNPLTTTQYTVIGSALGCTSAATASIVLQPLPIPTITADPVLCQGQTFTFQATGGVFYNWTGPLGYTSINPNNTITSTQISQGGVYELTVTAANSCTAPATTTLIVNPLPLVSITPSISNICLGINTVTLSSSGTATLFSWSPAPGLSSSSSASVNAYPVATTVYTLLGTLNSCTALATATVNVVPPPNLAVSLSSPSMCAQALSGSPNSIVITGSGATTYTINTAGHIANSNPSGPTTSLSLMPPYQPTGIETATLLGSNGVCVVSQTVNFVTVPNPVISVSNPTPVICAGQSYTYTSSGASSFTWSTNSPGSLTYTTGDVVVASPTINAVFSVVGDSLGCSSAMKSSTITVNPLPVVHVDPAKVCLNSAVALTALGTGTLCTWQPGNYLDHDTAITVYASPPATQNYTVTSSLRSCTAVAVVNVSVMSLPIPSITAPVLSLCVNGAITLQGNGGLVYDWNGPSGIVLKGQQVQFPAASSAYSGNYTLTATDINGCKATATQLITVYGLPTGSFDAGSLSGCAPFCAQVNFMPNTNTGSITAISWQAGGQSFGNNFKYCVNTSGSYIVKGTVADVNGCSSTFSTMVTAHPRPKADFTYQPELPTEGLDIVQFNDDSKQAVNYSWIFGNAASTSSLKDPNFLFNENGNYPVVLIVNNQWDCTDTIIKVITVIPDFAIYIPNTFTPNNDELNDFFGPVFRGVESFQLRIFDRWGALIFQTSDLNKGWDGFYKGESCPEGVYTWTLEAKAVSYPGKPLQSEKRSGTVLLYR